MSDSPKTLLAWLTAELDKALAAYCEHEKREQLRLWHDRWTARYELFLTSGKDYAPHPIYGAPTAADFLGILGEITNRRDALPVLEAA